MELIPLMASWVERGRELADLRETVSRLATRSRQIQVNAPAAEDVRSCRPNLPPEALVHDYDVTTLTHSGAMDRTLLCCTRCGHSKVVDWRNPK
jgi:hypothetical protein